MPLSLGERSLDETLLLMYAAQMRLMPEAFEEQATRGAPGLASLTAQKKSLNEVQALLTAYEIYYADVVGGLEKQGYASDHPMVVSVWKEMEVKTAALRAQSQALEAVVIAGAVRIRAWRRLGGGRCNELHRAHGPVRRRDANDGSEVGRASAVGEGAAREDKLYEKGLPPARKIGPTPVHPPR
jgi:hypothetical protein